MIHVLVEGSSERAFLDRWAKRLLKDIPFKVHPHQGKGTLPKGASAIHGPKPARRGLLDQLPAKLRGFAASMDPKTDAVVVLVDVDDDDAKALIAGVEGAIASSGVKRGAVTLAVEETEAFYLGDLAALERAFPDADMKQARGYDPDSICGTWELFGKIIGDGGENKVAWAEAMGKCVTTEPSRSRSPSFRLLVKALQEAAPPTAPPTKQRSYRHAPKPRGELGGRR